MLYRIVILALGALATVPGAAQSSGVGAIEVNSKVIEVSGSGHQRSFACEGRKLIIAGTGHNITTTGECSGVEISGVDNQVDVALMAKSRLEVSGSSNTLRWRAPDNPAQDISGTDHRIKRVK